MSQKHKTTIKMASFLLPIILLLYGVRADHPPAGALGAGLLVVAIQINRRPGEEEDERPGTNTDDL